MNGNGNGNGATPTRAKYSISSVLNEGNPAPSLLPVFPSLASNAYLPSSISSLSTSFTSAGTMPKASTTQKSVAQRRSQAPTITISETRKVSQLEFHDYLQAVGSEYTRWEKERKLGRRGTADLGNDMQQRRNSQKMGLGLGLDIELNAEEPASYEEENLPPLEEVPPIFFDPAFNLSNPRTFDEVTEKILPGSPVISRSATYIPKTPKPGLGPLTLADLAVDQMLQEKLSHFTAVVESHLVREIGLRSSSFFSALTNLQDLHLQGEACLKKIGELEIALSSDANGVNKGIGVGGAAKRGLEILRAQARRRGLEQIERGIKQVESIHFGLEGVKKLVENGDWMTALEVSEEVEATYYGQTTLEPNIVKINLTKIKSLDFLIEKLMELRLSVASSLQFELMGVLDREMELGVGAYMKSVAEGGWKGVEAGEDLVRVRATDLVRNIIKGLVRADGIDGAVAAWREAVLRDIRSMVREHLPTPEQSTLEDEEAFVQSGVIDTQMTDKSLTLAKNLKALTHPAFLILARDTYSGLLGCIEVVEIHSKVLLELTTEMREAEKLRKAQLKQSPSFPTESPSPTVNSLLVPGASPPLEILTEIIPLELNDKISLTADLSDVVHAAAELANIRFSKVMGTRTEFHSTKLSLVEFLEIFDATWSFIIQCEVICKRMIIGLRGVMVGQAKAFLANFHQKRITEGAKSVEEEQWLVVEVSGEVQIAVEIILECAVADPSDLLLGSRKKEGIIAKVRGEGGEREVQKQVEIDEREYFAVGAGLKAVEVLVEYLKIIINCPLLTTDAMSKVIEYMKTFNSRTCQVVLGAGAMRSAGLKNITAKHLALASQALSIMISLIPYVRETLRRHLNPKQAVMLIEFDKLKRDYQEHQNEIHSKLVAIMSDRLQIHCKTLQVLDWELPIPARVDLPNLYMESLVKEHVTLHKVLSRFLQAATVDYIMSQVVSSLKARLAVEYERITLKSEIARDRLAKDVKYLKEKLGGLKGFESLNSGTELEELIATKILPGSARPSIDIPASKPASPRPYIARRSESTSSLSNSSLPLAPELHRTPSLTITEAPTPSSPATTFSKSISTPLPPSPVDSPILGSEGTASPIASPAPSRSISLNPTEPPRRRSMAERLAELAGAKIPISSPPTPPKSVPLVKVAALPPPPEEVEEVKIESEVEKMPLEKVVEVSSNEESSTVVAVEKEEVVEVVVDGFEAVESESVKMNSVVVVPEQMEMEEEEIQFL